nr:unnamed protein product [Callosobruchus chinensis]
MNNWSDEEKACALTSMLRDSVAAILENLYSSDSRDYSKITSALILHNRTQQERFDHVCIRSPKLS